MKTAIHWFRRDLRLTDNTALNAAAAEYPTIVPVYVLSRWQAKHRWTGALRQQFLVEGLASLDKSLRAMKSRLIFRQGEAVEELLRLAKQTGAEAIYTNRDPDPFGQAVEKTLATKAARAGIKLFVFKDTALHERDEILTGAGSPFRVFTPYSRAWAKLEKPNPGKTITRLNTPANIESLEAPTLATWGLHSEDAVLPEASEKAAAKRLEKFVEDSVFHYAERRDLPALEGTSRISQDLRFGLLSIRKVFARLQERAKEVNRGSRSLQIFINELCWREFYFQVLWHKPEVLEWEYAEAYRGMPWKTDRSDFERWCQGQTGFPIVDAGMRQLNATGFMHNRVRMIVAMFLTKDLHQDWRRGEQWFMQRLLDGEIASNNGGWQWSSGTGTDAAPYFRIQNPWTQSLRFDLGAKYIKQWLPELKDIPPAMLHKPPAPGMKLVKEYPLPMVDHATERDAALKAYKEHLQRPTRGTAQRR